MHPYSPLHRRKGKRRSDERTPKSSSASGPKKSDTGSCKKSKKKGQNADGGLAEPEQIKENLVKQLHKPVLWVDCVRAMHEAGVKMLVEIGPGRVLCGLAKRIAPELGCMASEDPQSFNNLVMEASGLD